MYKSLCIVKYFLCWLLRRYNLDILGSRPELLYTDA